MDDKSYKYNSRISVPTSVVEKIKTDYIAKGLQRKKIIKKYNIAPKVLDSILYRTANCLKKREKFTAKVEERLIDRILDKKVDQLSEMLLTNGMIHQKIRTQVGMCDDVKDIRLLASALKDAFSIQQLSESRPTEIIEQQSININFTSDEQEQYMEWRNEIKRG